MRKRMHSIAFTTHYPVSESHAVFAHHRNVPRLPVNVETNPTVLRDYGMTKSSAGFATAGQPLRILQNILHSSVECVKDAFGFFQTDFRPRKFRSPFYIENRLRFNVEAISFLLSIYLVFLLFLERVHTFDVLQGTL